MLLLVFAMLTETPKDIHDYFQRAEDNKTAIINQLDKTLDEEKIRLSGETNRIVRGAITKRINIIKAAIEKAEKADPHHQLGVPTQKCVGEIPQYTVLAVLDEDRVFVNTQGFTVAVLTIPKHGLKTRQTVKGIHVYRVTATETKDPIVLTHIEQHVPTARPEFIDPQCYYAELIPDTDIAKYRATFTPK